LGGFRYSIEIIGTGGDGKSVELIGHKEAVMSLAYPPAKDYLLSASLDETIRIWNVSTKREIASTKTHEGGAGMIRIVPGGRLVSCGNDNLVRLWDLPAYLTK